MLQGNAILLQTANTFLICCVALDRNGHGHSLPSRGSSSTKPCHGVQEQMEERKDGERNVPLHLATVCTMLRPRLQTRILHGLTQWNAVKGPKQAQLLEPSQGRNTIILCYDAHRASGCRYRRGVIHTVVNCRCHPTLS